MEFVRYLPTSLVSRKVSFFRGGESCSFNFADTGAFTGASPEFLGCRVLNSYHIPTIPPKPGIGVFINRHGENENLVVSYVDGAVEESEARQVIDTVRSGLGWIPCDSSIPAESPAAVHD